MNLQSIILKGDDQRVRTMEVDNLLGQNRPKRAADGNAGEPGSEDLGPCETRVEVLRVDDQVRGIEVHCSCGEVTLVELQYPDQAS